MTAKTQNLGEKRSAIYCLDETAGIFSVLEFNSGPKFTPISLPFERMTKLDMSDNELLQFNSALLKLRDRGAALIIDWRGPNCKAHLFVEKFRANMNNRLLPIYGVFHEELGEPEKLLIEELGIFTLSNPLESEKGCKELLVDIQLRSGTIEMQLDLEAKFESAISDGDLEIARRIIDSMLFVDERNHIYMLMMGLLYEKKSQLKFAEETYRKILAAKPSYVKAMAALCKLLEKLERNDEAAKISDQIERLTGELLEDQLTAGRIDVSQSSSSILSQELMSSFGSEENAHQYITSRSKNLSSLGKHEDNSSFLAKIDRDATSPSIKESVSKLIAETKTRSEIASDENPVASEAPVSNNHATAETTETSNPIAENTSDHLDTEELDLDGLANAAAAGSEQETVVKTQKIGGALNYSKIFGKKIDDKKKVDRKKRLQILPPMDDKKPREILRKIELNAEFIGENELYNPSFDTISLGRFAIYSSDDIVAKKNKAETNKV